MMKFTTLKYVLLSLFFFGAALTTGFAQTVISGTVSDEATKEPLPGANVTIDGTINGTTTDYDGKFSFKTTAALPVKLKITNVGYQTMTVEVTSDKELTITMKESPFMMGELTVTGNRVEEKITKAPVTVEKITGRQLQLSPAFDQYSALQNLKGVDLLSQSMLFKSVNLRGFGANNNNRLVQLVDGMDNRSPGLGFGFGSAAGVSDLDIESIEILPGASSALYGPDALQGVMLTKTKSPFEYTGLTAHVKIGVNNVGKTNFGAKPYNDVAVRYGHKFSDRLAFKANLQVIQGVDFVADNYDDRMTRARTGFFVADQATKTMKLGYVPNHDKNTNFEYDGVNIYGDDVSSGGVYEFPDTHRIARLAGLVGKRVTRSGYREIDLIGDNQKIQNYRVGAALHYKLTDKIEASASWYYGNGDFIRTAGFREYYPNYQRNQYKLELSGDNFFVRGYHTSQGAVGYDLGRLAQRILDSDKSIGTWASQFATAYAANGGNLKLARDAADASALVPGSPAFNALKEQIINTNVNVAVRPGLNGLRFVDSSTMSHAEGMYNFKQFLPKQLEVVTGASFRNYQMLTNGTFFPTKRDGSEFAIKEYGAYLQASYDLKITENIGFKPTAAIRYDKNEYFAGGFTPRVSGVLSLGDHHIRGSWQSAFRNPSPNQLLADGKTGEIGGSQAALEGANVYANPLYTDASVKKYATTRLLTDLVKYEPKPENFTTEKIKTWEVGYKSLINNQLYIDAFYYRSVYNDFIATQDYQQLKNPAAPLTDFSNVANYTRYQVNFNNFNEIYVTGYGIGLDYGIGQGYSVGMNYVKQIGKITLKDNLGNIRKDAFGVDIVNRKMSNLEVSAIQRNFFISPEDRWNFTFSNPKVTKNFGFSIAYRWTSEMWVEQGNTQGDILLPSWNTIDAAVTYKVPATKMAVKLGATNLLNKYYSQGYGLAQIGGLYYIAFNFDNLLNH
jgi:iron complex outermembrane recepter protein